jgi:elongation factor P
MPKSHNLKLWVKPQKSSQINCAMDRDKLRAVESLGQTSKRSQAAVKYEAECFAANKSMISSNDFRPGVSIELDGSVWKVTEFLHVKPGKGAAFVRTKLKNVQTGNSIEKTFRAGESLPQATLEKSVMQHTYKEGDEYVFMNMETYDEGRLAASQIGDRVKYLKEGMEVSVITWKERVLEVELPNAVTLEIIETDPGVKGDTATGGTKPAKVETGATVMVPLFITVGEKIRIDTRDDKYLGRENS